MPAPGRVSAASKTPASQSFRRLPKPSSRALWTSSRPRRSSSAASRPLADLPAAIGAQAWAILPLIASGRTVGASCVIYEHRHAFSHEERTLFTAMSGMVAQAMERARLYDAEHRRAQELQRGLLPRCLPALPAVTASARYQPAGDDTVAGGDWYDVIPLSAEQVALVVGDVMGHGVSEAVTMGRLRTAGHTLADLEQPLDELFFHLNDIVSGLGDGFYATCLCIVYDPVSRMCQAITAGHPPPVILRPDGTSYFPDLPVNPPLGAATPPFDTAEFSMPDGAIPRSTPTVSSNPADWTSPRAWAASPATFAPPTFR
ncbi:PP2C family protein-serine/threonine phosphatase [Streptomyces sp. NBC_01340]|uniref:PP2C family protein-serine/threonine phosphatase n=1 Tax=Streptomyces sp. NBC_01340 TaxID=2903830 RepID=UPI002E136561